MARKYFYYSKRNIVKPNWLCFIQPSTTTTIIRCDTQSRALMHQLLFNGIPLRSRHQRRNSWYIYVSLKVIFFSVYFLSHLLLLSDDWMSSVYSNFPFEIKSKVKTFKTLANYFPRNQTVFCIFFYWLTQWWWCSSIQTHKK